MKCATNAPISANTQAITPESPLSALNLVRSSIMPLMADGFDPNNQFIGAKNFDIYNAFHTPLIYYTLNYVTMNAHPPLVNFNVDFFFVDLSVGYETNGGGGHEDPHGGGRADNGTPNMDNAANLSVFPNPASEVINGMVQLEDGQAANISVSSMTGQILLEQQISGSQQVSFDISSLPAGSYLFQVNNNTGERITKRFIVIR